MQNRSDGTQEAAELTSESRQPASERRREDRVSTEGRLRLWTGLPLTPPVEAVLIDASRGGFRARHQCASLCPGDTVRLQWKEDMVHAKVVWTRVLCGAIESGFHILPESPVDGAGHRPE